MGKRARAARALGFSAVIGPADVKYGDRDDAESKTRAKPEWAHVDSLKTAIRTLWR